MTQTKTQTKTTPAPAPAPAQPVQQAAQEPAQEPEVNPDYDMFESGGDVSEQQLEAAGFRRIQLFNENHTYHKGTSITTGGYGIKNEMGDAPPIGQTETIKHRNGKSTQMAVAGKIDVALIGFSQKYWVAEFDDFQDPTKRRSMYVENYIAPEDLQGNNAKCRMGISLFVVLKVDDSRRLYELGVRGYAVDDAVKVIMDIKLAANQFKAAKKIAGTVHPFAFWHTLSVGESRMVGKEDQSPITPPMVATEGAPALVSKEDYLAFIELRKELDAFLATGRYKGAQAQQQLAAPAQPVAQINAPGVPF